MKHVADPAGGRRRRHDGRRPAHPICRTDPLANLLLTMLDKAGIELDEFADSTGKIQELEGEPLAL